MIFIYLVSLYCLKICFTFNFFASKETNHGEVQESFYHYIFVRFFVCGFVFVLSLYAVFFVCGIALIGTQSRVNFWWPAFEAGGPAVLGEKVCALMKT